MRLPWQKDKAPDAFASSSPTNSSPSSPETKKKSKKKSDEGSNLKNLLSSKNNQSTGSYVIYDENTLGKDSDDTIKTSDDKLKKSSGDKEKKKKKHHHHHHHHKKDSSDELKDKETPEGSNEEIIPNTFKNLRKSSPAGSPGGSPLASNEDVYAGGSKPRKDSLEHVMERDAAAKLAVPAPSFNSGRRKSMDASILAATSHSSSTTEKEKKKKKDKHDKKSVSFNEFDIQLLPEGAMVVRELKSEPKVDEVPYHKRGKQEYKEKKEKKKEKLKEKLLKMEAGDHVDLESDSDIDGVLVPALNVLTASEEALNKPKEVPHSIRFSGQLPQLSKINEKASIILHNVQVAKYTPEIKGTVIIKGKDELLIPGRDDSKELKLKVRFYFDDWDSKQEIKATPLSLLTLKSIIKKTPPTSPHGSKEIDLSLDTDNDLLGFSYSIPIHKTFLPALYKMLHSLGMNTADATFQVDGVIVFGVSVYKGDPPPPAGPLDGPPPPDMSLREIREREKLIKERDLLQELSDQIVLSTKFELTFAVEKNPANLVREEDLLHPSYKPAAVIAAEQ